MYPPPKEREVHVDAEGNHVEHAFFEGPVQEFRVAAESSGEVQGPHIWPDTRALGDIILPGEDEIAGSVKAFCSEVSAATEGDPERFPEALSQRMHTGLVHVSRPTGLPLTPEMLLRRGQGACRDLAVLFTECCKLQGIPARFVSGYLPAAPGEKQHMHAWAEVFVPGKGWVAFDPTRHEAPGEEHIPVAASFEPAAAAPIEGTFMGAARCEMAVDLKVLVV